MQVPTPLLEHNWLHRLIGSWTYESEAIMGPGQPPITCTGTQVARSLGGLWILSEGSGGMPGGGTASMLFTLGYDPAKQRFVGTFVASCMNHLWIYDGGLQGDVLTLDADGPSFADPTKTSKYQDIFEIVSDDHHTLTSQVLGDDGRWTRFMTAHYRRAKT